MREFLDTFDVGGEKDGKVTLSEFENYYSNISASIDDDVYFELMIRNAWHISGGEGQAANTSNRRVLITNADGSQTVREVTNDLGIGSKDKAAMAARLGVRADQLGLTFGSKESSGGKGAPPSRLAANRAQTVPQADMSLPPPAPTATAVPMTVSANLQMVRRKQCEMVLSKLKSQLAERGARGIAGLQRKFKIMDDDGSKSLSFEEFRKALLESGLQLSDAEIQTLFKFFDSDNSQSISFDEFIIAIRVSKTPLYAFVISTNSFLRVK